jgi:hypothetical protein
VRLRSLLIPLVSACALAVPAGAAAYPWPVKPFNKAHPVRANFGDPRTIFSLSLFTNGLQGPGDFQFHNGVDISAKDGTPVYPVVSGTVKLLGYVARTFGHVHLTEIRGFRVWNPLARGGLAPYVDSTKPRVTSIFMRAAGQIAPLDPLGVCGTVSIVAEAYDWPAMKVPGTFAGFPVSPALVTWSMRKVGGSVLQPEIPAFDVRIGLPTKPEFWDIYGRGTYQNAPRFANRQFNLMPGRFLYNLNSLFDTRTVANGVYQVSAAAEDVRDNRTFLNQRFTIVNQPGTPQGCPV